jgi:predicted lipid carrier protein YhbT
MNALARIRYALQDGFKVPEFDLPRPIGALHARLPQLPPALGLTAMLNLALDRILPRETLEPLTGKLICLRVLDGGLTLRFTLTPHGFRPAISNAKPDLSISAKTCDFLSLALRQEDADTLFFSRRLVMEGDTDLGLLVKNTLDAIDLPRFKPRLPTPLEALAKLRMRLGPSSR